MTEVEYCDRCRREITVEADEYFSWEVLLRGDGSVGLLCPGCLTVNEEAAIAADLEEISALTSRCQRCRRDYEPDPDVEDGWEIPTGDGGMVCPNCLTPVDRISLLDEKQRFLEEEQRRRNRGK